MNTRRIAALFFIFTLVISLLACSGSGASSSSSQPPEGVFMGDSLTSNWDLKASFPGKVYVNQGTTGDTSANMLARFPSDVVSLKPRVVLIWAGGNDIPANIPLSTVMANLMSMRNQAVAAGIKPILCTVPPEKGTGTVFNPTIVDLNTQIASLAASTGTTLADYYAVLVDPATGSLKVEFTSTDNTHINAAGYQAITPVAANAIANAK